MGIRGLVKDPCSEHGDLQKGEGEAAREVGWGGDHWEQSQEHREEHRLWMEAGNAPKPCPRQLPFKPPRGSGAGFRTALGSECLTLGQAVTTGQPEGTAQAVLLVSCDLHWAHGAGDYPHTDTPGCAHAGFYRDDQ